jgi:2-amino-4-hydroxy-6-hydroxymethyldihydropteridine diphosphokinase
VSAHFYLIALGSNQRHIRYGWPKAILAEAMFALENNSLENDGLDNKSLENNGMTVLAQSSVISSAPLGASQRLYANSAVLIETRLSPLDVLLKLQAIEKCFGRKRQGQRWRARTLDLDIILWSGGIFAHPSLRIPHQEFRKRRFVVQPAAQIAPHWRDPLTRLSLRQLQSHLDRKRQCV